MAMHAHFTDHDVSTPSELELCSHPDTIQQVWVANNVSKSTTVLLSIDSNKYLSIQLQNQLSTDANSRRGEDAAAHALAAFSRLVACARNPLLSNLGSPR
jgi:hypothetical protein